MKRDDQILESLIAGGVIGAAFGALFSKDTEEGITLGAIAGAAILATYRASEKAKQANISVLAEENGKLYEISAGGQKRYIRDLPKQVTLPMKNYKLK
jgi:hypothetical protein